jgi:hypothetical protein
MRRGVVSGLAVAIALMAHQAAAQGGAAAKVPACPYTASELKAALGLDLEAGRAAPALPFQGGTLLGCQYSNVKAGAPSLRVNQTVMDDASKADPATYAKSLAGRMEPIPGDPDRAAWQSDQGDLTNAALHYARKGVIVSARVSIGPKDPGFQAMKERLAKLRRIPD